MLKACPRCQELVLDDSGECRKCQKRFAPDRLPPLSKYDASKLLMDRQKEKAQLEHSGAGRSSGAARFLRYPLYLSGVLLAAASTYLLLHMVVMDLKAAIGVTAGIATLTLVLGLMASSALDRAAAVRMESGGRLTEVDQHIRLLEDEVERLKKER